MIVDWKYCGKHEYTQYVKRVIAENDYVAVDVGASVYYWSYPECKIVIDGIPIQYEHAPGSENDNIIRFDVNLDDKSQLYSSEVGSVLNYIDMNGKFDYSICSHTLEDVYNPVQLVEFLTKISNRGYIAFPSKFDEFKNHYNRNYFGHAHHKSILDVIDNELYVFPKYPFIEKDSRSDFFNKNYGNYTDLVIFWEDDIPVHIFGSEQFFSSDDQLMSSFYEKLSVSVP